MTEVIINDIDHVEHIHTLQKYLFDTIDNDDPKECGWRPLTLFTIEALRRGQIAQFHVTNDAAMRFMCGNMSFIGVYYAQGYYHLKLFLQTRRVVVQYFDRTPGLNVCRSLGARELVAV